MKSHIVSPTANELWNAREKRLYNYCYERAARAEIAGKSLVIAFHTPYVKFTQLDYLKRKGHSCAHSVRCLLREYDERKKRG